ncbi:internal virion protein A [Acinetobacter virus fBenAci003]|uniref:Internal virion protein A n=1 Tax=Acinetobacter virus fBenAci003 TaxID=2781370 RepID=A0A7S6U532_9CAUD|nr:internal virion protein A [Acinetobacter virus fBenAci003]
MVMNMQGGMQGAQIGSNFGPWGAAIGGVLGLLTPDKDLSALKAYNKQVVTNLSSTLFDMDRQRNVENLRTSQALDSYRTQGQVAASQFNAAFGAADIIGASADALKSTLDRQVQQATRQVWLDWEVGVDNYNTQINEVVNRASGSLRRSKAGTAKVDYAGMFKQGMDMYQQYKGGSKGTTTMSSTGGGLSGLSDFGSFGKSGSAMGTSSAGSLTA